MALRHRGHQHLQQPVVLALAGRAVAVLGGPLDELHAHFVMLELNQEPVTRDGAGEASASRGKEKKKNRLLWWLLLI